MWYLFANFVVHTKKHINVCFALYIFPVFVHRKSWARFMLFPSLLPRPSPSNFSYDFSSPAVPSLICISHIYLEQKHLLHIALLNGTDRMILDLLNGYCLWQAEGGENFHLLYHPLHSYSHSFCNCWLSWSQEAEGNSRRELSSQEFWSETMATAESWLTDCWWECEAGANFFVSGPSLDHDLFKHLTHFSASQRHIPLSFFKIKALSDFADLPDCI